MGFSHYTAASKGSRIDPHHPSQAAGSVIEVRELDELSPVSPVAASKSGKAEIYCESLPSSSASTTTLGKDSQIRIKSDSETEKSIDTWSVAPVDFENSIATQKSLDAIIDAHPLPEKHSNRVVRYLRWNFFSVYRKIFTLVFIVNAIVIVIFFSRYHKKSSRMSTYSNAATAASANLSLGVIIRNEHVVNAMFRVLCSIPRWTPLWLRRHAAKVYSFGGVHSGSAVAGSIWYIIFCVLLMVDLDYRQPISIALAATGGVIALLLVVIVILAHPTIRVRYHNLFENMHRFGGWTVVGCFWAQVALLAAASSASSATSLGASLVKIPTFWFLIPLTLCIIYPWARLRRRSLRAEPLSRHAIRLHFDYEDSHKTCLVVRLADSPLTENHGFATIPSRNGKGFSVLVSRAGDWTSKVIDTPPTHLYVKGGPTLGVTRVALMFRRVLIVATGSGIGPCLSLMQNTMDQPVRVLWSTPNPLETYGPSVLEDIFRADRDAVIVDTKKTGRGNLLALAYAMMKESDVEACIVISNQKVTRKIIYGLEARKMVALAPIFDS